MFKVHSNLSETIFCDLFILNRKMHYDSFVKMLKIFNKERKHSLKGF